MTGGNFHICDAITEKHCLTKTACAKYDPGSGNAVLMEK